MVVEVLAGVGIALLVLVVVVSLRSPEFHIERSIDVNAPPERVFSLVNDFHSWSEWSPWEKMDPNLKRTYAGAESGVGAVYSWVGNKQVGEGRMTIEKSQPAAEIAIKLEFIEPFAATNQASFTFARAPGGSKVTWAMDGKRAFMMKAFSLFVDMDKLIGKDFEKGLSLMKSAAERASGSA